MRIAAVLLLCLVQDAIALKDVNDFCAQYHEIDLKKIGDTKYDLVILDHSRDFPAGAAYVPDDYATLRKSAGGAKLVIAYLSVGAAQSSRYYWKKEWSDKPPAWLGAKAGRGAGFHVKYWDADWQAILTGKEGYLERLIRAGFDGVMFDGVDNFDWWENQGTSDARTKMVEWVDALAKHARQLNPKFLIFADGGEELVTDGRYLAAIDAAVRSHTYVSWGQRRAEEDYVKTEGRLDRVVKEGKKVFVLDTSDAQADADFVYARAKTKGYVAYCGPRGLNKLAAFTGHDPD